MSTFSPSLRIELITTGDQAGTWGTTTNTNLGGLVESAIAGYVSVSVTSANQALTALNGAPDESRNQTIALTTTTAAPFAVYAPPAEKTYVIYNASAYAATLYNSTVLGNTTAAGAGAVIPAGKTVTLWSDGTNFVFQNNHMSSLTLTTDLAIADGGTGASTAADARTNFGLGTMATQAASSVSITGGSITGITDLAIADGGTGASTASDARTNLGLGTMAVQAASSVAITGGSITGITDLAVADGGTGASTASDARTNLGLGTMATQASSSVSITGGSISGITDLTVADGGTGASTAADARTNLGLGTMATQAASSVAITGGSISGITDLAVADGGTGASTAVDARANLGLTIGTNIPSPTGAGSSGTWPISINGNVTGNVTGNTNGVVTAAIGSTAVTATFGDNDTSIATTAFVQAALQAVYPIGSIYTNAGSTTNPATLLGFGTWAAFGAGRVMVGLNGSDTLFDALEETGGSKDTFVIGHTHTATASAHDHASILTTNDPQYGWNGSLGTGPIVTSGGGINMVSGSGKQLRTSSENITVTVNSTGITGTDRNLQPYITVAMWKRTA